MIFMYKCPAFFKLVSYYEDNWKTTDQIFSSLLKIKNTKEGQIKLISSIQIFENFHRFNQFHGSDLLNNQTKCCSGLMKALQEYYNDDEGLKAFYFKLMPFIIKKAMILPLIAKEC